MKKINTIKIKKPQNRLNDKKHKTQLYDIN